MQNIPDVRKYLPNELKYLGSNIKTFIITNNILTTMAAVTIAFSTGTMIRSLVSDIILPGIYALIIKKVKHVNSFLKGAFAPINTLNVDNFLKEIISWIMVIIVTYLIIGYALKKYILAQQAVLQEVKPEYIPPQPLMPQQPSQSQQILPQQILPQFVVPEHKPILQENKKVSGIMGSTVVSGDNFYQRI